MIRLTAVFALAVSVTFSVAFAQEVSPGDGPTWLGIVTGAVRASETGEIVLVFDAVAVIFTDRPAREVSLTDVPAIVAFGWGPDGDFIVDPPNASLINMTTGTIGVVELTHVELEEDILAFTYVQLEGASPSAGDRIAVTIDGWRRSLNHLTFTCKATHAPLCP